MIERPLDRLNYYNGQRLDASDLKLEQDYHIRVRRWLNKSLYKPGIASGLDVRAEEGTRFVIVSPGMALDAEGREIVLLEEERVFVPGVPHQQSGSEGEVSGPYLTIRYNEEPIQEERNGCISSDRNGGSRPAWGGPALVRAKPILGWSDSIPYEGSGEVVLAQVELTADCAQVHQINTAVRRYVGQASEAKVRQYALEGERHIDKNNPARIYFHVRGRQPNAVTLYLRAEKFSTLYYTENGHHSHGLGVSGTLGGPVDSAAQPKVSTDTESGAGGAPTPHEHTDFEASYFGNSDPTNSAIFLINARNKKGSFRIPPGIDVDLGALGQGDLLSHISTTSADPFKNNDFTAVIGGATPHVHQHDHTHAFSFDQNSSGVSAAGIWSDPGGPSPVPKEYSARSSTPLTYVDDLQVTIDGIPVHTAIVEQLKAADPTWRDQSQDKLGNGSETHPLAAKGTGEIKLDFLPGLNFIDQEHWIELSVAGEGNGGRILYNLYVE